MEQLYLNDKEKYIINDLVPEYDNKLINPNIFFTNLQSLINLIKKKKENEKLENEELKQFQTKNSQISSVIKKIEAYIQKNPQEFSKPENFNLIKICIHMSGSFLIMGLIYFTLQNLLSCLQVYLLDVLTDYMKDEVEKIYLSLLLVTLVTCYLIQNIFYAKYDWLDQQWITIISTTLQYLLLKKSFKTKVFASNDQQNQENQEQEGQKKDEKIQSIPNINNLMTSDIAECVYFYWGLVALIVSILKLVIILLILYYKMGNTMFLGLYVLLGCFFGNLIMTFLIMIMYESIYARKDIRVSVSKDVIEGIKSIKYLGWEQIFERKIKNLRFQEFKFIIYSKVLEGIVNILWACMSYVILYFLLTKYYDTNAEGIQKFNIFTIIALFGQLTFPLGIIPWAAGYIVKSRVNYNRIKLYLNQKEIDQDLKISFEENDNKLSSSYQQSSQIDSQFQNQQISVYLNNLQFSWPSRIIQKQSEPKVQSQNINILNQDQVDLNVQLIQETDNIQKTQGFTLKIEELAIQKGTLNIIIGQIGSGKTALLQAILNELDCKQLSKNSQNASQLLQSYLNYDEKNIKMDNFNQKIIVNGSIAYVSQNHWLQTKTIKENILFGKEYDEKWYKECIEACDLQVDFTHFAKKDEKSISQGGNNLSGGQRQRISICRAIYACRDIYLFDDIFSSLDAHVAKKLYEKAIIDLLIRKLKKTVIFVTSHYDILHDRTEINKIIYIDQGKIIQDQQEIDQFINNSIQNEIIKKKKLQEMQGKMMFLNEDQESDEDVLQASDKRLQLQNQRSKKSKTSFKEIKDEDEDLQNDEEEAREQGDIKWDTYHQYFKSMSYIGLLFLLTFLCAQHAIQIFIDFWLRDFVSTGEKSSFFEKLNRLYNFNFQKVFEFLIFVNLSFSFFASFFYNLTSLLVSFRLFKNLNKSILYSKMKFFDANPLGRIVCRISSDMGAVDDYLSFSFHEIANQFTLVMSYPIGILINFPWIAIPFVASLVVMYYFYYQFKQANRELKRLSTVNNGKLLTIINENCNGIITIRSFNQQKYILKDYLYKLDDYNNSTLTSHGIQVWLLIRILMSSNIIYMFVCITCLIIISINHNIDYNIISMCLAYSILFSDGFANFLYFQAVFEQNLVSVERISMYFNNDLENPLQVEQDGRQEQLTQEEKDENCSIIFKNLYVTYDDVKDRNITVNSNDVQFALKNINLKIKKGEKVAFCGRTGSGKTSILNVIFNLYPFQFGSLFIDNKNIKLYSLKELRQKMSIIPQFGFLYNSTLRDNIDPDQKYQNNALQEKINTTNLKLSKNNEYQENQKNENEEQVQQKIDLDFVVEEGGKNLSNGEKQIINFLRILIRDTDIICLDEATSNMDPQTDQEIHDQLFKLAQNKTLIVITHRLENIDKFDKVVVLDNGKIVECGNVQELRQIKDGFFNKLIKKD